MLQSIREHTQGWIAGTIISIVIFTFALWGIHSYFVGGTNTTVVAKVNGIEITKEQLAIAYERLRRQTQAQLGSNNIINAKEESILKSKSLQALTEIETLKQASLNQDYNISNQQVDNYLQSMPDFQVDGRFSVDRFQEILSSTLMSTSEFLDLIKTSLLIDQPKLGIVFTSFSLPNEIAYVSSLVNQERAFEFINIPFQFFLNQSNNVVSFSEIQKYYNQNKNEFLTPEQVTIEYIELSFKDLLTSIHPNDTQLNHFYNENINAYTQALAWKLKSLLIPLKPNATTQEIAEAEKKLEQINQALSKGESFTTIAAKYPDKTFNADKSLTHNQIPVELQKVVLGLSNDKPYAVVRVKHGFLVINLLEIKEPQIQSFEAVKDKVKEAYIRQRAEEKFAELREKLANLTYEHPDSLQFASKVLNLPIKTSELFTKDKGSNDISQYRKVREIAFSPDVLHLQNNSDLIQLHQESFVVLRVKAHITSTLLPLENIAQQIEIKIKAGKVKTEADKLLKEIIRKLEAGEDPNKLAAAYHFKWIKSGYLGRYSTKVDSAILDLAFHLPNPANQKNKISFGSTKLPNGSYALVALRSLKNNNLDDAKQYAIFSEQVQNSEGLLEYELYKQNELRAAKIKIL